MMKGTNEMNRMKRNLYHSETSYIRNQSRKLSEERLGFMDGIRLSEVDIFIEDNATVRQVRRIMEKRISQQYWNNHSPRQSRGNRARHDMKSHLANHMKNIFGGVPSGFRYGL